MKKSSRICRTDRVPFRRKFSLFPDDFISPAILIAGCVFFTITSLMSPENCRGEKLSSLETRAEMTEFRETTSYENTIEFIRQLQRGSPYVRLEKFGESSQGRPLYVAVLSRDGLFSPGEASQSGKPVVLISNGIHSGEICGKEASLMLMREIIRGDLGDLLGHMVILVVPVLNVDGHENVSLYNRLNQNGPEGGMGFRANALGFDLNRDFMKLETPEIRSWVSDLFTRWQPHLTIDTHTTDGYDHRYALNYLYDHHPTMPAVLEQTLDEMIDTIAPKMRKAGYPIQHYGGLLDKTKPELGFKIYPPYPRLCTSYVATHGRLALLSEAHSHKDFETRVMATYHFLKNIFQYVNLNGDEIVRAVDKATGELIRRGSVYNQDDAVVLEMSSIPSGRTIAIEGWKMKAVKDDRTGMEILTYTRKPRDYVVPLSDSIVVTRSVTRPAAYLIPPEYGSLVVDHLLLHGIRVERAVESFAAEVEVYHVDSLSFRDTPYQGHLLATPTIQKSDLRTMNYPAGTYLVGMDQTACEITALLLEPESIDGLLAWNRMNNITTDPKIREGWALAKLGEKLMDHPEIAEEFKEKGECDPDFLEDENSKAEFFWEHSAYKTPGVGDYPITRCTTRPAVAAEIVRCPK